MANGFRLVEYVFCQGVVYYLEDKREWVFQSRRLPPTIVYGEFHIIKMDGCR